MRARLSLKQERVGWLSLKMQVSPQRERLKADRELREHNCGARPRGADGSRTKRTGVGLIFIRHQILEFKDILSPNIQMVAHGRDVIGVCL